MNKLRKATIFIIIFALSLILLGCNSNNNKPTVPTENEEPTNSKGDKKMKLINDISVINTEVKQYEKVELQLFTTAEYDNLEVNPFNYAEIRILAKVKSPQGEISTIPAFWYQEYDLILNTTYNSEPTGIHGIASRSENEPQGLEVATLVGDPHFRIRLLPKEEGKHNVEYLVFHNNVLVQTLASTFEVSKNDLDYKGLVQVEQNFNRNFVFENGQTFIPIGQNTSWYTSSTRKTIDYEIWFEQMALNNANLGRIWLAPWSFSPHWDNYEDFSTRLNALARLDRTIELAAENEIYFMLVILNHGQFSETVNPMWNENPWNVKNGGFLDLPSQFFTNKKAAEIFKNQLLYLIARYSYSKNIMSWELFNEVDWTDQFSVINVHSWHKQMADYIKENDPYNHLVTTSYKHHDGAAYSAKNIEFANPHDYGFANKNMMVSLPPIVELLYKKYRKPIIMSEIGIDYRSGGGTAQLDPTGISLKQAQWAGVMGGSAGAAMNWWWDSWVHPNDLYYRFKGVGAYAKKMDMTGESYELLGKIKGLTINNSKVGILGYKIDHRIYGYVFDKDWKHSKAIVDDRDVTLKIPLDNGSYKLEIFDTNTGEIIKSTIIEVDNKEVTLDFTFNEDYAFMIR